MPRGAGCRHRRCNGLRALPSATNFVAIGAGRDSTHARAIVDGLMQHGVFIRMPGVARSTAAFASASVRPPIWTCSRRRA